MTIKHKRLLSMTLAIMAAIVLMLIALSKWATTSMELTFVLSLGMAGFVLSCWNLLAHRLDKEAEPAEQKPDLGKFSIAVLLAASFCVLPCNQAIAALNSQPIKPLNVSSGPAFKMLSESDGPIVVAGDAGVSEEALASIRQRIASGEIRPDGGVQYVIETACILVIAIIIIGATAIYIVYHLCNKFVPPVETNNQPPPNPAAAARFSSASVSQPAPPPPPKVAYTIEYSLNGLQWYPQGYGTGTLYAVSKTLANWSLNVYGPNHQFLGQRFILGTQIDSGSMSLETDLTIFYGSDPRKQLRATPFTLN